MMEELILKKIKSLDEAIEWRNTLKNSRQKLVVTNGCFDILHKGHATYLMKARELGDKLLIGINSDESVRALKGNSRPVTSEMDRALILACLEFIDAVVVFNETSCENLLRLIKPDIYVKGGDYTEETMNQKERKTLKDSNSIIKFIPFVDGYSTTSILSRI